MNANINSVDGISIAASNNGDVVTFMDKIIVIDKAHESDVIFYEHSDGNLYGLRDNPDGTKALFYKDSAGNTITKSFDSFTNTEGLTSHEDSVVIALGYTKFAEETELAAKYYNDNPDIINSSEFSSLPQAVQDKITALYNQGQAIVSKDAQGSEIISGGLANDSMLGSDGNDGLGIGSENFTVENFIHAIQVGTKEHQVGALLDLYSKIKSEGSYNSATDIYSLNGATIEDANNTLGGTAVKISYGGIAQGYITKYDQGNFQQRVVETVGIDGRTNTAEITIADGLVNQLYRGEAITINYPENFVFGAVGGYVGNVVGQQLQNGELAHDIIVSAITRTAGSNIGDVLDFLSAGQNDLSEALFDPFFGVDGTNQGRPDILDDFLSNLQSGVVSVISSKLVEELGDVIDIDGVGGEVFNVAAGTITTGVVNEGFGLLFNSLDAGAFPGLLSSGFDFSTPFYDSSLSGGGYPTAPDGTQLPGPPAPNTTVGDFVQAQVFSALAGYAGNRLAGEVITPESEVAAIFGAAGSALGVAIATGASVTGAIGVSVSGALSTAFAAAGSFVPVIGTAIGAFVGTVFGTALGNVFGGDDEEPAAWAHINYSGVNQEYYVGANWGSDGGDAQVAASMAQQAINGINDILDISHGKLRSGASAPRLQIGYEGNEYLVAVDGGGVKSFGTSADAILYAAYKIMTGFDLVGGHAVAMRAWHNSDASEIFGLLDDIQVAEAFQNYLANPTAILALMMDQPDSELAQSWAAILQRAAELELHLPHEKDLDGGWGEILLAQGTDSALIPEISGDSIILTDPITGEETILHHVIGPGYEIVRIEGTDGNDIIEVIVDGPSVTYVDGGAGNDTIEGSDQADVLVGGAGDDIINGNDGNDWLHGGSGADTLDGGAGEDLVVGGQDNDYLAGNTDTDHIYGNGGDDHLVGNEGKDFLYGGAGNDILEGNEGSFDELYGQDGDDVLKGGDYDYLIGGKGNDTYLFDENSVPNYINIERGDGHDVIEGQSRGLSYLRFASTISINELFFKQEASDLVIYILGEDQSVTLKGYYGPAEDKPNIGLRAYNYNILANGTGSYYTTFDSLIQADSTVSESPNGTYNVISDAALASGTSDFDGAPLWIADDDINGYSYLSSGNDNANVGGANIYYAGAGNDVLYDTSAGGTALFGDSGNDEIHGGDGNDLIVGGLGDDNLFGDYANDRIYGAQGNDQIRGGSGNDYLYGGSGDDYLEGYLGHDQIEGNEGQDLILGMDGNDVIYGGADNDDIDGGEGNDTLYGGEGDDIIKGGAGIDTIQGDIGNDVIDAGKNDDWVHAGKGSDTIIAGFGDDVINGGLGDDLIKDGSVFGEFTDNDQFFGGAGDDTYSFAFNSEPSGSLLLNQNSSTGYGRANNIEIPNDDMSVFVSFMHNGTDAAAADNFFHIMTAQYHRTLQMTISNSGKLVVYFANVKYDTGYALNNNETHDILFNWDKLAGEIEVYHNGQAVYSQNVSTSISFGSTGTMMLGQFLYADGNTVDPTWDFEGEVHELTIWDQKLSASEAGADSNRDTALHYFPFNADGSGSVINETGNGNIVLYGDTEWISNETNIVSIGDNTSVLLNDTGGVGYGLAANIDMPTDAMSVFVNFVHDGSDSASDLIFQYHTVNSNKDIQLSLGGANQLILYVAGVKKDTGYTVTENETHEIFFTWDSPSGQLEIFDNQVHIYSSTVSSGAFLNETGDLSVGQFQSTQGYIADGTFDFDGEIKEITVWDSIITLSDFVSDPDRNTALHHYDFDNLEGNAVTDHLGGANIILSGDFSWIGSRAEHDFISDTFGNDTIVIEDNSIALDDLRFWRSIDNEDSLIISLHDAGNNELQSITVEDHFLGQAVENISFADGYSALLSDLVIRMDGNVDDNILRGTDQKDELYGHDGNDQLFGFDGDDLLYAGAGQDILEGGAGADTFVFSGTDLFDGNLNTITDFSSAEGDLLSLIGVLEGYDPVTDAINDFITLTFDMNDTIVSIDKDGNGSTHMAEQMIVLENTSSQWTDAQAMINQGSLIVA